MNQWHAFLTKQGAQWQEDHLISFAQQSRVKTHTRLVPMLEHQMLEVTGVDAGKFLQGQVTCDIKRLASGEVILGAHCNRQGRMLSSFITTQLDDQKIGLRMHQSVAQETLVELKKYVVFSKAELMLGNQVGLALINAGECELPFPLPPAGQSIIHENIHVLHHSNGLIELWLTTAQAIEIWPELDKISQIAEPIHLTQFLVSAGHAEVQQATSARYIPQHFNYQIIDGISFKKGCYTGQEIVARMQYRSQLKKHCYRMKCSDETFYAELGTELFNQAHPNKKVAEVIFSAPGQILVVCDEDAYTETESLNLADSAINFTWAELPYAIP